jgi:3-dehydroquinate dehydratase I
MTTRRRVKGRQCLVGVIASAADLRFALRMKQPPDLFELRLDCLYDVLDHVEGKMSILPARTIVTARDPREGGANNLPLEQRRELLRRFLPYAKYVDVELRLARALKPLLAQARKRNAGVILSFHDFKSTPSSRSLRAKAALAKTHRADIFKVATRTEKPADLARLLDFVANAHSKIPISAMGMGKLGGISRLLLTRGGSVLNYASLRNAIVTGQLTLDVLRSALPR